MGSVYMLHEEYRQATGPLVKFTCRECRQGSVGRVLHRERRPYYFGIPLGVERQVVVRCGNCGIEYFAPSLPMDTPELCDVDHFLGKINSPLFPKLLIVLMLLSCPLPLIPFFIHFFLRSYREYIRGLWKKLHKIIFWISVGTHLVLWLPMFVKN